MKVAVMGYGTIGSGVVEALEINRDSIALKLGREVDVKYVLDLRDFPGDPVQDKIVHDVSVIVNDPEVEIVVETMGGTKPAYEYVKAMLMAGKSVATSNKALVAAHGTELLHLAREKGVNFLFEASVGGGIPIVRPMNTSMTGDKIEEIIGILNGTTNFILTKMEMEGANFEDALREAQSLGYAERDPSADVEGQDACRKIAILTSIAYRHEVDYTDIYTEGVSKITPEDVAYAKKLGRSIKLLASSRKVGDRYYAMVAPVMIGPEHPLYGVRDVYNAILVKGNISGPMMFYGCGAGKLPTAGAVIADVIAAARNKGHGVMSIWDSQKLPIEPKDEMKIKFFLRLQGRLEDRADQVKAALPAEELVSLDGLDEFGVLTGPMTEAAFEKAASGLEGRISMIRVKETGVN